MQYKQGFTLLETLVALILISMLSVLLIQGLTFALMIRERALEQTQFQREDALRRAWFIETTKSAAADLETVSSHAFVGDSQSFRFLTLHALQLTPGIPAVVEWLLEYDGDGVNHLYYRQDDQPYQRVWSWQAEPARFRYFDPSLGWGDTWNTVQASRTQMLLPAAVKLETTWLGEPHTWFAPVVGRRNPRPGLIPEFEL